MSTVSDCGEQTAADSDEQHLWLEREAGLEVVVARLPVLKLVTVVIWSNISYVVVQFSPFIENKTFPDRRDEMKILLSLLLALLLFYMTEAAGDTEAGADGVPTDSSDEMLHKDAESKFDSNK